MPLGNRRILAREHRRHHGGTECRIAARAVAHGIYTAERTGHAISRTGATRHIVCIRKATLRPTRAHRGVTVVNDVPLSDSERTAEVLQGRCHCGSVHWTFAGQPEGATACNCTVCRRYGVLWAYDYLDEGIKISG